MRINTTRCVAFAGLMVFASVALFAQSAAPTRSNASSEEDDVLLLETFNISGTRASLMKARELKQESKMISDTIVAEDIAKFPDLNLAESLQRLPGVAINREAGEGRRVSLRGLGPDFTRVQLNGMEVLGNVDSPQDSRGQRSRDRAFDFNIFASELFTRMDVYKSFDASQNEGGLAGTIGLFTAKPFDHPGFNGAISTQIGSNTQTADLQTRGALLISNTWGKTFGALLSVAYSNRLTEEQGTNTFRWRPAANANGSNVSALPAQTVTLLNTGQLRFARGNRMSSWGSDSERLGITSAFQWRPNENVDFTLDVLHGEFTGERTELHLNSRGANASSWLGGGATVAGVVYPHSTINELRFNERNEVVYMDVSGGNVTTESRRQLAENTFDQIALSGNWRINHRLKASALIGTESSDFDMPSSDKFYLEAFGGAISDYTRDPFYGYHTYKFDTANPANWNAHEIDFSSNYQESDFDNAKLDFNLSLQPGSSLKFGVARQGFSNYGHFEATDDLLLPQFQSGAVDDSSLAYAKVFRNHKDADWVEVDWDKALSSLGITRPVGARRGIYTVKEVTTAGYLSYEWEGTIAGKSFFANAGLRGYRTKITSSGVASVGPLTVAESYDDILPAVNSTLKLRDNLLLRASLSQNINRPTLSSMAVNGTVSNSNGEIKVNSGNPGLKPYDSDNIDLSLEWYFGENVGYAAIGFYHKRISGFIGNLVSTNVPYSETGLPLSLYPGLTETTNVAEYSRPVNYEDSSITGLEFSLQSDLRFLPAPFDNLGFIGNVSLIDGELDYASPAQQAVGINLVSPIAGLSDVLGNATLYYETKKWGARLSANYRGGYVAFPLAIANDQIGDGFNSTLYVDCSAFYQINEKLKLTLDVINLTDQREEQYSDLVARRQYNTTTAGTSFFAGVNYRF